MGDLPRTILQSLLGRHSGNRGDRSYNGVVEEVWARGMRYSPSPRKCTILILYEGLIVSVMLTEPIGISPQSGPL